MVVKGDRWLTITLELLTVTGILPGHVANDLQTLLPVIAQLALHTFDMHGRHIHILHHALLFRYLRLDIVIHLAQESVHLIRQRMVAAPQRTEESCVEVLTLLGFQGHIGIDGGTVAQQFTR